jgi:hypothetical protein
VLSATHHRAPETTDVNGNSSASLVAADLPAGSSGPLPLRRTEQRQQTLLSACFVVSLLGLEALFFTLGNRWFLADLGVSAVLLVGWYLGSWGALTLLVGRLFRDARTRLRLTAGIYYLAVSHRVLAHDASVLDQGWGVALFSAVTLGIAIGVVVLERLSRNALVWIVAANAYAGGLLTLQYLWSLRGGAVFEFLTSVTALVAVVAWSALAVGTAIALRFPKLRLGIVFTWMLVPSIAVAGLSRRSASAHEMSLLGGDAPDLYVFSIDALRKDVFDEWCRNASSRAADLVCRQSKRYEAVVSDGISTYQVLTRNLQLGSRCKSSIPGALQDRGYVTTMYLGRKGKRIEGASCFDHYFSGAGRTLAEDFAVPSLFDKWLEPAASSLRGKYIPTGDMLRRFAGNEGRATGPVFSYFHVLDLHAPYVPAKLANDPNHLAAVNEFMDRCYWKVCDLTSARERQLLETMHRAYLAGLPEVEAHLEQLLDSIERRKRPYVLIVTADHGELFGEHGGINHSGGFVTELLSIPFAVYRSDAPQPKAQRDCALRLSSEALAEAIQVRQGGLIAPGKARTLSAPPLGVAIIDQRRGAIDYRIDAKMLKHSGTWRNVHPAQQGTQPFPTSCVPQ